LISFLSSQAIAGETSDKEDFVINSSNYEKFKIENLVSAHLNKNNGVGNFCLVKWRLVWGEVEKGNVWAMLAYVADYRSPAQINGSFKGIDANMVRYINRKNLISYIYYTGGVKNYVDVFESQFTNLRGKSSPRLRIADLYFEKEDREGFVAFANCVARSVDPGASRACFKEWSSASGVMKLNEYVKLVNGLSISSASDLNCN
jgi:hypothetical protein